MTIAIRNAHELEEHPRGGGGIRPNSRRKFKRARPGLLSIPDEKITVHMHEDPGKILRVVVHPTDYDAMDAFGGADAVAELITDAIEAYGIDYVLELITPQAVQA